MNPAAILLSSLLVLALPQVCVGQVTDSTTGAVVGTVRDEMGAVLRGVVVSVAGDALMRPRTTTSGEDGRYRFTALPPGDYILSTSAEGFAALVQRGVRVDLGFTTTADLVLHLAPVGQTVTVRAEESVLDRHGAEVSTTYDGAQLATLPSSRSLFALLSLTPAVEVARTEVGGSTGQAGGVYSAYGTRGQNRPTVEGISVAGIFSTGATIDHGSLAHASVVTGGHSVEWALPGVHSQFVVKSGGNRYSASLYADYEDRHWQAYNVDADQMARGASGGGGLSPRDANRVWRYHDLNADVGGFVVRDRVWWYASGRDQHVASRLVNFPVRPHRTLLRNYTAKVTYGATEWARFVGFVQASRNREPNGLDLFAPSGSSLGPATAVNTNDASTADQRVGSWIWKGEWSGVLSDAVQFEVRAGGFSARQRWTPRSSAPRVEDIGTLEVRGGNRHWESATSRPQVSGAMNYFRSGTGGAHHVRIGGEVLRITQEDVWHEAYPGNVLHVLRNGSPAEVYFFDTPGESASGFWWYGAYASDSWRLHDRLTVNGGLRFDRYRVFLPPQVHGRGRPDAVAFPSVPNVIDWNVAVPRISLVYRLAGGGRTLLKGSYGRYRIPGAQLGSNVNPNANPRWERYLWDDSNGSGLWDRGEERGLLDRRGGVASESVDPDVEPPITQELGGWIEREVRGALALRTGVVWRGEHQHQSRQNPNWPFDQFGVSVDVRDPGPDGRTGTDDDGPVMSLRDLPADLLKVAPQSVVANIPWSVSDYWTWELAGSRRTSGRWSFYAGVAHTWHRDHAAAYSGQPVRTNTYVLTPNDTINTDRLGRHAFRTWSAKASGTYNGPWGLRITPVLRHQSGQPFGRTFAAPLRYGNVRVLAERVGARRMDNITIADVRVEKAIPSGGTRRFAVFADVFNLLNANPEQNMVWSSGATFLRPLTIVPPRILRVGTKLEW